MGFVHVETINMKQLYLQSYFDSTYLAFVVGPTVMRLTGRLFGPVVPIVGSLA